MPAVTDQEPAPDPTLAAERDYLAHARADLARMREHTLSLQSHAGDRVSGEFLAWTLWQRAKALADDPTSTLFFGRIDTETERWYIGRRHVSDPDGEPRVIDWRAPVSTAFYRASRTEPMGVLLRRRFGVDRGQLTAYEDEHLADPDEHSATSRILAAEIERPRVGPMRDIVATIQPEQDLIVRADVSSTICVQGAPGTGKTAVGLHRAAWLLYAFRDRLSRQGVLVVGPNEAFLDHIGAVLPALGEIEVRHSTLENLVGQHVRIRAEDSPAAATLKGDGRWAEVLHRAVWSRVRPAQEALVVPRGSRRWRVGAFEVQEILDELSTRGVRYEAARAMLPRRLAHAVLVKMEQSGDSPDDRVHEAIARSRPVTQYAASLWPPGDPETILFGLLSDDETFAGVAGDRFTAEERAILRWQKPPRSKGSARWSQADAVLLDEVSDLLERSGRVGHVVLDEAQDLSAMQLRAVGRRAETGSMTILGDIAQGTTPWATDSWEQALQHLGKPQATVEILDRGFRVPAAVIDYAARLLPAMAPDLGAPVSVRDDPGRLDFVTPAGPAVSAAAFVAAVTEVATREGSIGVIVPDAQVEWAATALLDAGVELQVLGRSAAGEPRAVADATHPIKTELDASTSDDIASDDGAPDDIAPVPVPPAVSVVPARTAKGLEFDHVVVVEPAQIAAAEPDHRTGLRRLYVVLTRAVTSLTVVHAEPLPQELGSSL